MKTLVLDLRDGGAKIIASAPCGNLGAFEKRETR